MHGHACGTQRVGMLASIHQGNHVWLEAAAVEVGDDLRHHHLRPSGAKGGNQEKHPRSRLRFRRRALQQVRRCLDHPGHGEMLQNTLARLGTLITANEGLHRP